MVLSATVGVDKVDYAPGETALITASNDEQAGGDFAAGETVKFQVTRTDGIEDYPSGNLPWFVTDGVGGFEAYYVDIDGDGAQDLGVAPDLDETVDAVVHTSWFVEDQYANSALRLSATGLTSGAEAAVEFTDTVSSISINSPSAASPQTITTAAANYTVPVGFSWVADNKGNATVTATATVTDGTNTWSNTATINNKASGSATINVTVPGSAPNGSYSVTVSAPGQGATTVTKTNSNAVVLNVPAATTTSITSTVNPSAYGQATSFNASVSGSPSVGTVQFYVDGATFGSPVAVSAGAAASGAIASLKAGSHSIHAIYSGGAGFSGSTSSTLTQTVNQVGSTVAVSWADGLSAEYNGLVHGATASWSSSGADGEGAALVVSYVGINGTSYAASATAPKNAGQYRASASFVGDANHTGSNGFADFTIAKATLTVTADPKSREYGDANPALTATITGFKNSETLATSGVTGAPDLSTAADPTSPVGEYPINAALGALAASNYTFTFAAGNLEVTQATLLVTADDQSREYGDANPTLTATITGFKNSETLATSGVTGSPDLSSAADPSSPVGDYPINAALGTLAASNYSFTFAAGNLEVTHATLLVTRRSEPRVRRRQPDAHRYDHGLQEQRDPGHQRRHRQP
ncbi:MAG: MBG domain-containing protein [Pirellulales bacterium]